MQACLQQQLRLKASLLYTGRCEFDNSRIQQFLHLHIA
jgi:hypothetical protein